MEQHRQNAVWQRVMDPPRSREDGFGLLLPAITLQQAYRQLGAKALYEAQTDTVACLRGLMRLAGRTPPAPWAGPPKQQATEQLLRDCYRESRRAAAEYLARSADPETGVVFRYLSDRESTHCAMIAALLGKS